MALYGGVTLPGLPDLENVRKLDMLSMPSVLEMQRYGMAIDKEHFYDLSSKLKKEMAGLRSDICSYIPPESLDEFIEKSNMSADDDYLPMNVDSAHQLADLLFNVLKIGAGRTLKRTKGGERISTGKRQLEQLKREHPILPLVLRYREYAKLDGTYCEALPKLAILHRRGYCQVCESTHEHETWRIHTVLLWTRTNTGRFASKKPNLQNQPIRSAYGKQSRAGFVASPGMVLVSCDFGQLQLRFLAHLANDDRMIQIFNDGLDMHTMTAMWAFGLTSPDQVDPLSQRAPAKNVNFAIAFGETEKGLFDQLVSDSYGKSGIEVPSWLTLEWCREFLVNWHGLYTGVQPYLDSQTYRARRYGCVWDMFGRIRRIPEVCSAVKKVVAEGIRYAGNFPIQAPDSGVMRLAMAETQDTIIEPTRAEGIKCWPVITVHDELIVEVEEEYGDLMKWRMESVMENVLRDKQTHEHICRVPITASGSVMKRWSK